MPFDPNQIEYMPVGSTELPKDTPSGFDPTQIDSLPTSRERSPSDPLLGGVVLNSMDAPKYFNAPNDSNPAATLGAMTKSYMVDDPYTKMKIFSESRGIPIDRYGIHEGEIVFESDDGKIYYEIPPAQLDFPQAVKSMVPGAGQAVLSGLGYLMAPATGGGSLAIPPLIAGGIEGARKAAGATFLDEPVDPIEIAKDVTVETALAGFGDMAMRGATKAYQAARNFPRTRMIPRGQREAVRLSGESAYTPQMSEAYGIWKDAMERYGIDLNLAQATQSPDLANAYKLLRDLPETAREVIKTDLAQDLQIERAAFDLFEALGSRTDGAVAGAKVVDAAKKVFDAMKDEQFKQSQVIYNRAFRESEPVNIGSAAKMLDKAIEKSLTGSPQKNALESLKTQFYDGDGKIISDLAQVDSLKKSIDAVIYGKSEFVREMMPAAQKSLFRTLNKINTSLLNAGDKASAGLYKEAREKWLSFLPQIDQARNSVLGQIRKLDGDQVAKASQMLLSGKTVTPETAKRTFNHIRSIDPDAADEAITSFLSSQVDAIKADQTGYVRNVGGKLYQKIFGSEKQRKILEAVMSPDKYSDLKDFMAVIRKAGITSGKESATATRQEMLRLMGQEAKSARIKGIETLASPVESAKNWLNTTAETALNAQYRKRLFEVLGTGRFSERIKQLKRMDPRTEKYARTLGYTLIQMMALPDKGMGQTTPDVKIGQADLLIRPPESSQ